MLFQLFKVVSSWLYNIAGNKLKKFIRYFAQILLHGAELNVGMKWMYAIVVSVAACRLRFCFVFMNRRRLRLVTCDNSTVMENEKRNDWENATVFGVIGWPWGGFIIIFHICMELVFGKRVVVFRLFIKWEIYKDVLIAYIHNVMVFS